MNRSVLVCFAAVSMVLSTGALAQGSPQGGAMDLSKMGPWTRKPSNEAKTRKEVQDFFKQEEELMKKNDQAAMLDRVDFPVFMVTDDAKET